MSEDLRLGRTCEFLQGSLSYSAFVVFTIFLIEDKYILYFYFLSLHYVVIL